MTTVYLWFGDVILKYGSDRMVNNRYISISPNIAQICFLQENVESKSRYSLNAPARLRIKLRRTVFELLTKNRKGILGSVWFH